LKQVSPQPNHVTVSDDTGSDGIRYGIFGNHAVPLQPVLQKPVSLADGDSASRKFVDDVAFCKNGWRAYGSAHRGALEGGGFGGVAAGAGMFLGAAYGKATE
jgi:hypothetical protein